jgi:hypothetical protein
MEPLPLSFGVLLGYVHRSITEIKDPRQASNGTRYSLKDAIWQPFQCFFMQCESFLEHQRQRQSRRGKDNAQTLFGLVQIQRCPKSAIFWTRWRLSSCLGYLTGRIEPYTERDT